MNRIIRQHLFLVLTAVIIASLAMLTSCNVTPGGTGRLNVLVTDSPSDDWRQVTVVLKSISLRNQADKTYYEVWAADPNNPDAGKLNLVELADVAQFLGNKTIPAGNYDRLKLIINTDPTTITLVDDSGYTYPPGDITVVDPSQKGEIKVDLNPAIEVEADGTAHLQVDFNLAHPLSIIVESGKVVINLQIRHKAVPRNLRDIQFARTIGKVKGKDETVPWHFTITTDQGSDVIFEANEKTIFVDVDKSAPGTFTDMPVNGFALVDSNMKANGDLYARRVWYSEDEALLPKFSPEGLVRWVGDNWIEILNKNIENKSYNTYCWHWDSEIIFVDENTTWTFKTDISMGTGTAVLNYIRRGFRVTVELVDPNATPKVAKSINVQSAHDQGAIMSVTDRGFTFGGRGYCHGWNYGHAPYGGQYYTHEWLYSTITDHLFSWWFFGLPSSSSQSTQDFIDTVNQAKAANLRVFAWAELYWDADNSQWVAENVILAPEKLPGPTVITTGYTDESGSMEVSTFDWDNETLPTVMTVFLDKTGDLQTVVGSIIWNWTTRIVTFTIPVLPEQWESFLTPPLWVKVWVRPVKNTVGTTPTWEWHAYTVIAFQIIH